jgi:flagellar biogenesis protein FliO
VVDGVGGAWGTIGLIGVLILVLLAAYFTTRFLSRRMKRLSRTTFMEVVDRLYVSRGKYIILIKSGDKGFLIGVTNQTMVMLGEVTDGIFAETEQEQNTSDPERKGFLDKIKGFLSYSTHAQEELRKARVQAKSAKTTAKPGDADEMDKIMAAIEARKQRYDGRGKGGDGL